MGLLGVVLAVVLGKISIDVLVVVFGGALIKFSMDVLEAVLAVEIEGALAGI